MNSLPTNPFLLSGYISPEYFCDRISETKRLRAAFENGHTWYVQMVLNRIYESRQAEVGEQLIDSTINSLLNENEATYQTLLRIVSPMQRKTLTAVAREGIAKEVYSKTFTNRHRLGAVSSVQVSIQALVDKELLLDDGNRYSVYDRFFSLWLAKG